MSGRLNLLTPWARQAMTRESKFDVIEAIPDDYRLDVSVSPDKRKWVFRLHTPDGEVKGPMHVSASMSATSACFYSLRHWGLTPTTVTVDALGYIKEIEDAG